MTFEEIVAEVTERLNLTSDKAMVRIGKTVNNRYREMTSSIGLNVSRRAVLELTIDPDSETYDTLPDLRIEGLEKVLRVQLDLDQASPRTLDHVSYHELTTREAVEGNPRQWADKKVEPRAVTIRLDATPTEEFTLLIEGYDQAEYLVDGLEPAFPESFHDILVEGAMAEELRKMEKSPLAQIAEQKYQSRLSDLRMFLAKSAFEDIYQSKLTKFWYIPLRRGPIIP